MMNLSGDAPMPINQIKFIMLRKLKQFWVGNELLTCITGECEIISGVKFILTPRCVLTCSGQLCERCQSSAASSLLWVSVSQAGRSNHFKLNPHHPLSFRFHPLLVRCHTCMLLCRLIEWVGRLLLMSPTVCADRCHCLIVSHFWFQVCYVTFQCCFPARFWQPLIFLRAKWKAQFYKFLIDSFSYLVLISLHHLNNPTV